jgi:hypothetical protein
LEDFALCTEIRRLVDEMIRHGDRVISMIEIRAGIPRTLVFERNLTQTAAAMQLTQCSKVRQTSRLEENAVQHGQNRASIP